MKISVIIPVYNSRDYIKDTLISVINQSLKPFEIIIINDCSSDDTINEIISLTKNTHDINIVLLNNISNLGVAASRNHGILNAKGDYLAFCDSDDIWHKDKLYIQLPFLLNYPIVGSCYNTFNNLTNPIKTIKLNGHYKFKDFLTENYIAMSSVILNKKNLDITSDLFESVFHEDYLFWLKLLKKNKNLEVLILPDILFSYRVHDKNISRGIIKKIKGTYKIYRLLGYNYLSSFRFTFYKLTNALIKHYKFQISNE